MAGHSGTPLVQKLVSKRTDLARRIPIWSGLRLVIRGALRNHRWNEKKRP
jgi:hypothetical protein